MYRVSQKTLELHDDFNIVFVSYGIIYKTLYFEVSQLKHLTQKTTSLGISKMWSTIFSPLEICSESSLLKINKTV